MTGIVPAFKVQKMKGGRRHDYVLSFAAAAIFLDSLPEVRQMAQKIRRNVRLGLGPLQGIDYSGMAPLEYSEPRCRLKRIFGEIDEAEDVDIEVEVEA